MIGSRSVTETFLSQSRYTTAHEIEKLLLFPRLRSIRHEHNHAAHTFKIHGSLSGKQENRNRIFDRVNDERRLAYQQF